MKAWQFLGERGLERCNELLQECPEEMQFIGKCGFSAVPHLNYADKWELLLAIQALILVKNIGWAKADKLIEHAPEDAEAVNEGVYIKGAFSEGETDFFRRWSVGFGAWVEAKDDGDFVDKAVCLTALSELVGHYKTVKSKGSLPMAKADMLFLSDYEKESPYWQGMKVSISVLEVLNEI